MSTKRHHAVYANRCTKAHNPLGLMQVLWSMVPRPPSWALCLLLGGLLRGATAGWAQESVPLVEVLSRLNARPGVSILYEPAHLEGVYVVAPRSLPADVRAYLKETLPATGLRFRRVGRSNYVIKPRRKRRAAPPPEKKLGAGKAVEVMRTVEGVVLDAEQGQPLVGSTIRLKGTAQGTTTDEQGRFALTVPRDCPPLEVSYLGFETQEVVPGPSGRVLIHMKPRASELEEIIVTAVGIAANKRNLAYAIDNLKVSAVAPTNEPNLVNALTAQVAGLWVNSASGSPGASAGIFIRGQRSVNGSNKPLFVLDGMPLDNSTFGNSSQGVDVSNRLIDLNPHDIESISILKGAAATALYGIRAANGAIVLSSRKGEPGRPRVRFYSAYGLARPNKLPPRQTTYAQGKYVDGEARYMGPETSVSSSYGPPLRALEFDGDPTYPYDPNGRLVPKGQGNGLPARRYDPYATFFVTGQSTDNFLSISGGSRWVDYYLSYGHFFEKGIEPRSTFRRHSLKSGFTLRPAEALTLHLHSNLLASGGYRLKRGSMFSGVPLGLFRNPNTFDIGNGKSGYAAANDPATYTLPDGKQRSYRGNGRYDNPFWSVNHNPFEDEVQRLVQSLKADYRLAPWLGLSLGAGFDSYRDDRRDAFDIHSGTHRDGQVNFWDIRSRHFNSDLLLSAEWKTHPDWMLKATLGHNYFASVFRVLETEGKGLAEPGLFTLNNAQTVSSRESLLRKKIAGVFFDVLLRYRQMLYLNLTGRNDWSSTLPPQNNAFFYPSISVGFEFSELLGWTDSPGLSYGKLRASWSRVGNDAQTYLTDTYFDRTVAGGDNLLPGIEFPAFGVRALEQQGTLGNPHLKPETLTALELGADLRFFRGRLLLDLTWYRTLSRDQIVDAQLSAATGFLRAPRNAGTIENTGWELSFGGVPLRRKDFRWEVGGQFTRFRSIVRKLPESQAGIVLASFTNVSTMILEGQPYGVLVGTAFQRDAAGRRIIGADGFPLVSPEHRVLGDPTPDWLMGLRQAWTWKGFTLSALVDIRSGGDIWNGTRGVMSYLGISKESGELRELRGYVFEGVTENGEPNTRPVDLANPANGMSGIYWRRYGFIGLAEAHIEPGSWVRLRELKLSWVWQPRRWFRQAPNLRFSLAGYNLLLFTPYSGIDPETNLRGDSNILGWDYFNMPNTKSWNFSLEVNF